MSETGKTARRVDSTLAIEGAGLASRYLAGARTEWQPSGSDGFWVKPLYEDAARNERTMLIKVDPGAYSPPHAHEEFEEVYILEGSFWDDDHLLVAGDYVCREAGSVHGGGSDEGGVMLVVYRKR